MKNKMILTRFVPTHFDGKKWHENEEKFEVRVMAEAEGYSMVRRLRGGPFVCLTKQLSKIIQSP